MSDQSHTNILTITFTQSTREISSTTVYILQKSHCVQQPQCKHWCNQYHTVSTRSAVGESVQSDCQQHATLHTVQLFWQNECQILCDVGYSSWGTLINVCVVCVSYEFIGYSVHCIRDRSETAQCCTVK